MEDFNDYAKKQESKTASGDIFGLVGSLAKKFDGKNQTELLKAVYEEAKKGKRNGTLSNADIDNFAAMLAPMLDAKQKNVLHKVVAELKRLEP